MNYEQYKQRIRRFTRDDLMIQSSFLSWKAWEIETVPERERMDRVLVRAYAPRVFAISAATGTNFKRAVPGGTNTRDLCKLHLEIADTVSNRQFLAEEKEELITFDIVNGYLGLRNPEAPSEMPRRRFAHGHHSPAPKSLRS